MEPFHLRLCLACIERIFFARNPCEQGFDKKNPGLPDREYPVAKVSTPGVS
jgi:hypothetical protein